MNSILIQYELNTEWVHYGYIMGTLWVHNGLIMGSYTHYKPIYNPFTTHSVLNSY